MIGTNTPVKNEISIFNQQISMTSLDISELVNKRHDNVKRTIETMIEQGVIRHPQIEEVKNKQSLSPNSKVKVYIFSGEQGKRDSIVVVAQLSPEFTARLVDRWQELESGRSELKSIPKDFPEALRLAADLAEKNKGLAIQVNILEPKAQVFDILVETHGAITLSEAAKSLGTGRNRLCSFLRQQKWLTRTNEPYQEKIEQGLLDVKLSNWEHPENGLQRTVTTLVTSKGISKLSVLLNSN